MITSGVFHPGDNYDVCAICLDEYEEGDKLRVLPCSHGESEHLFTLRDPVTSWGRDTCSVSQALFLCQQPTTVSVWTPG